MTMKRLFLALGLIAALAFPAPAAERKPLVIGATGQQQQIQATDTLKVSAATTANASINIPPGVAPSAPNNGDCWTTSAGLFCQIAGVTVGPMGSGGGSPGGSSGQIQYNNSGAFGGFTASGDATVNTSTGVVTVAQAAKWTTARTLAITGDLAYTSPSLDGSGNVTAAGTLATVNSNVGSFTNANITVNAKGLITAASTGSGGSGTVTNTGTLTANRLILGNAGVDVTPLGSLGTTTTVLHGNASGAPSFGAVSLSADVTGTLPVANGGTGQTSFTDGQLLIGNSSGNTLTKSTLTAGAGINVANSGGGITVSALGPSISGATPYIYTNAPFANVSALLHFEGTNGSTTITDQIAGNTWTAAGTAAISTAQSVFGSASLLVPGSGTSGISMPTNSKFDVALGDWTIEFRLRYNGTPQGAARVFQTRNGDVNAGIGVTFSAAGVLQLDMSAGGAGHDMLTSTTVMAISQSGWNAVIIQRRGNMVEAYLNGEQTFRAPISGSVFYSSGDSIVIGGNVSSTSRSMNAYMDEFRFTKGVALISQTALTYPSTAFPDSFLVPPAWVRHLLPANDNRVEERAAA